MEEEVVNGLVADLGLGRRALAGVLGVRRLTG